MGKKETEIRNEANKKKHTVKIGNIIHQNLKSYTTSKVTLIDGKITVRFQFTNVKKKQQKRIHAKFWKTKRIKTMTQ